MTNTPGKNKQTAKERRYQTFIDLVRSDERDAIDTLYDFLEQEVRAAYGRGFRDGQRAPRQRRPDFRPRREHAMNSESALKNGKLRPTEQNGERA